jgi:hypothetical protein
MSTTIQLKLRKPHAGQSRIYREKRRFNVISCGRRFGKTIIGTNLLIEAALEGAPVAWGSPTYKMLLEVWRDFLQLARPVIAKNGIDKQNKRVTLINGAVVEFWSLTAAESIRGRKYRRFIMDEAAMVPGLLDVWNLVIRPTLADYRGDAFFLSTPKGRNGFWELFQLGQDALQPDWASFQMPTTTNPHIDPDEIEGMRGALPELVFLQEFLAQFLENGAGLFRKVMASAIAEAQVKPIPGHSYVFGVDWGRSGDYTVISVVDSTTQEQVYLDRFNQVDYELQKGRLEVLNKLFRPTVIVAEANNMGGPLIESLRQTLPIQPFVTTNASKKEIIDDLALGLEQGSFRILNDAIQLGELLSFEQTKLPSGLWRYAAAGNGHDDTVIALALAKYAAQCTPATGQNVGVWRR